MTYIAAFLTTVCVLLTSGSARAWTEAQVTSVSAQLDVTDPALARIDLEVCVRVQSGWLTSFELVDLDPGLEPLSDAPAELIGVDGRRYVPALSVVEAPAQEVLEPNSDPAPLGASSVTFSFAPRTAAPQRGEYRLRFAYTTAHWDPQHRSSGSSWSLPRWPGRLHDVSIRVLAPPGSRILNARAELDDAETRAAAGRVELLFRRLELPRTQSFAANFELPAAAPSRATALQTPLWRLAVRWLASALLSAAPDLSSLALGLALGAVWLLKRGLVQRSCREQGVRALPLVRLGAFRRRLRLPLSLTPEQRSRAGAGLCAAAVIGFERFPLLAAISGAIGSLSLLDVIPEAARQAAAARSLAARLLDAHTREGAAACLGCYLALVALYAHNPAAVSCAALLAAPLFLSAVAQPAFLRSSSTSASRSFSSRPTTSGAGSKSTRAD